MAAVSIDKRCCLNNCRKTRKDDNVILHIFPNPTKDSERFELWRSIIGGDIITLDSNIVFKHRRVCHSHFETKYHTASGRLSANAVPTLNLPGTSDVERNQQPLADITNRTFPVLHMASSEGMANLAYSTPTLQTPMIATPSTSGEQAKIMKNVLQRKLKRKIKVLQKAKENYATKLKKALNLTENVSFRKALMNFTSAAAIFILMQFRESAKPLMGRRFTKKEKIMALSVYKHGPKAYRLLRKMFVLPSPITLSRMISNAALKPGINDNLFQQLKSQIKKFNATDKLCVLLFDEIALTPHFDYNRKSDRIVGFVNNGQEQEMKIADHALVFMIRGVSKNYKQPVYYSFCAGSTSKITLARQIKEVITKLHSIGFRVIATVCDQGASNVSAINYLIEETRRSYIRRGLEFNNKTFEVNAEEVIPLYDIPHLIKGIRNNLLTKTLTCTIDGTKKTAKWEHITLLYKENDISQGLRLIPKLTDEHVDPKKLRKMKVKCATQVFSRTVASTMLYLTKKAILPAECAETADVILFLDNLFDSMNGSYTNSRKRGGKPLLGSVKPNSNHQELWTKAKKTLSTMKFINSTGKIETVPSVKNWLHTIEAVELVKNKLFSLNVKSIWLRHFNQDPLENFFGSIRSHGVRNISPTCVGFESAFASLLINNFSKIHSPGANCEEDSGVTFKSLGKLFFNKKQSSETLSSINYEHMDTNVILGLENKKNNPKTMAQLSYVSGFLLKKTRQHIFKNCKDCNECFKNKGCNEYVLIREQLPDKKLLFHASVDVIKFFSDMQDVISNIIRGNILQTEIKCYIKTILCTIINFDFIKCKKHKAENIEYMQDLCSRIFLCNWCRETNKILSGRRSLAHAHDVDEIQKMAHIYCNKRRK